CGGPRGGPGGGRGGRAGCSVGGLSRCRRGGRSRGGRGGLSCSGRGGLAPLVSDRCLCVRDCARRFRRPRSARCTRDRGLVVVLCGFLDSGGVVFTHH